MKAENSRLYYIDWLRLFAFVLLFLFHAWRPFDHFSWHIKNNVQSDFLDILTLLLHGWRMDLIFLVSGVGTWFALKSKKSNFLSDRVKRLIIPFIFGVLVIVPPQKFYEAISFQGFSGNYIEFLKAYPSNSFSFEFGTSILLWFGHLGSHIYYLPYLFVMTIVFVPLYFILSKMPINFEKIEKAILSSWGLFLLLIPMLLIRVGLKQCYLLMYDFTLKNIYYIRGLF